MHTDTHTTHTLTCKQKYTRKQHTHEIRDTHTHLHSKIRIRDIHRENTERGENKGGKKKKGKKSSSVDRTACGSARVNDTYAQRAPVGNTYDVICYHD